MAVTGVATVYLPEGGYEPVEKGTTYYDVEVSGNSGTWTTTGGTWTTTGGTFTKWMQDAVEEAEWAPYVLTLFDPWSDVAATHYPLT